MAKYVYIDDKFYESINDNSYTLYDWSDSIDIDDLIKIIEGLPTIEVVRCKECKHRPGYEGKGCFDNICPFADGGFRRVPDDDFFCKEGERRDE